MNSYKYYKNLISGGLYNFNDKIMANNNHIFYMLDRTQSIFEYENLPDTVPQRILELYNQINGFSCWAEHNGELYVFYGGLGGEPDMYYRPTICTVSNPYLNFSKNFKIDEECIIMRNDSLLRGLMPLFNRYASLLTENEISMRMANINSRVASLVSASDDITKESAIQFFKDIESGELGIIGENAFLDGVKSQNYVPSAQNVLGTLIEFQQYLKASWFNELGLNANYNMKREAINTSEAQLNDDALLPFVDDMMRNRQEAIEKINKMFGTDIKIKFSSSWEEKQEENKEKEDIEEETSEIKDETEEVKEEEKTEEVKEDEK